MPSGITCGFLRLSVSGIARDRDGWVSGPRAEVPGTWHHRAQGLALTHCKALDTVGELFR